MRVQYVLFMMIMFLLFIVYSVALIPFAWIFGIIDKIKTLKTLNSPKDRFMNVFIFIPFGIPILCLDCIADLYYFWANSFKQNLKKIIIEREESTITHYSIKEII